MGLGFYTPLLNMSRGFLFAQSLRLIIVYTILQMNLAQFPVFHLRSIKHPQPNRDSPAWTLFHASLDLLLLPAQNEHMGDRPFFTPLFPFLFEDYFCSGQIKSDQTLHYTIPMSTLLSAKWNRLQWRVDGVWGTIQARVRGSFRTTCPCHISDSDANFVVYHSSLPFR